MDASTRAGEATSTGGVSNTITRRGSAAISWSSAAAARSDVNNSVSSRPAVPAGSTDRPGTSVSTIAPSRSVPSRNPSSRPPLPACRDPTAGARRAWRSRRPPAGRRCPFRWRARGRDWAAQKLLPSPGRADPTMTMRPRSAAAWPRAPNASSRIGRLIARNSSASTPGGAAGSSSPLAASAARSRVPRRCGTDARGGATSRCAGTRGTGTAELAGGTASAAGGRGRGARENASAALSISESPLRERRVPPPEFGSMRVMSFIFRPPRRAPQPRSPSRARTSRPIRPDWRRTP